MSDVSEELARLAKLRDEGVLTPDEFEAQKAKVLNQSHGAPPAAQAAPAKSKIGKGCMIVAAVIVVLIIIGAIASGNNGGEVVPPGGDAAPATETSEPSLTMDGFNRVKNGMTFDQVTAIIGKPSQELSRSDLGGTETVMYMWEGSLGANMNAMFQNGKLVQKAQFGLH